MTGHMDIKFPHMSVFVVRYADQWFNSYDNLSKAEKKFRQLEQLRSEERRVGKEC